MKWTLQPGIYGVWYPQGEERTDMQWQPTLTDHEDVNPPITVETYYPPAGYVSPMGWMMSVNAVTSTASTIFRRSLTNRIGSRSAI